MKYLTAYQDKQSKLRAAMLELWPDANSTNLPSYQSIVSSDHPYIEASIQELIRIALTAPSWHRRTTQDVVVLGHRIPAGTDVFGAPSIQSLDDMDDFVINPALRSASSKPRHSGKWSRESKGLYQPERWLDAKGDFDAYAGPMLPFGAGPRGCFGMMNALPLPLSFPSRTLGASEKLPLCGVCETMLTCGIGQRLARIELRMMIIMLVLSFEFRPIPEEYASFRAEEVINRGPHVTYIRPILRT